MEGYCLPIARARRVLLLARQARVRLELHATLEAAGCRVVSRESFRPSDLTRNPHFDLVLADATLFEEPHRLDLLAALRDAFCRSRFVVLLETNDPWERDSARKAGFPAVLDSDPASIAAFAREAVYAPVLEPPRLMVDAYA